MDGNARVLFYTTWTDTDSAEAAGRALVADRLAACVNILGAATAIYSWQGAVERDAEHPMLVKTVAARVPGVLETVRRLHPCDVPACAVVPIVDGDPEFLAWIEAQTAAPGAADNEDGNNDAE